MKKNKLVYVLGALLSMGVVSCDLTEKLSDCGRNSKRGKF
mgnify:CR=1 FL=1